MQAPYQEVITAFTNVPLYHVRTIITKTGRTIITTFQFISSVATRDMVKARKYVVKNLFDGWPKKDDFDIIEYDLQPLRNGEILVKVEWISVDPYQRLLNSNSFGLDHLLHSTQLPYEQFGYNVGTVIESKDSNYPVGVKVVSHEGWKDYYIINTSEEHPVMEKRVYKLPELQGLSDSLGIGTVGMPGATAYFGFLEVCQPKSGETVVVTGAAGAVGSVVGQIAKIKGCKVIGFAGSDDKVKWLVKELGFDKAYNYKTVDIRSALAEGAPEGIDCYFDNVGGEISTLIMNHMKDFGRVAVCGAISAYNNDSGNVPLAPIVQPAIIFKQLTIKGVVGFQWIDRWSEAFEDLVNWIKSGKLKTREHVTEGFENIYDAFVGMMKGDNFGKAIVKV